MPKSHVSETSAHKLGSDMTDAPTTELQALKLAWQALLRGGLAERDRLVDVARRLRGQRERLTELRDSDSTGLM